MSIKCFVLMSFGSTPEEKRFSDATYDYFLVPIAEGLGYEKSEIDRADISGRAHASLAENYIIKIANAELVIADLSSNSASVYYELGVRHALVRKHTVILAPKVGKDNQPFRVAFDVSNDHHIYRYDPSHDIEIMTEENKRLIKEIKDAISISSYEGDSPIFHHIREMRDYRERTQTNDQQIIELKSQIERLNKELADVKQKAQDITPAERELSEIDFDAAQQEQKLYGSEILKSLESIGRVESETDREVREKEEQNTQLFVETLQTMNSSQFIDARTFRRIATLCEERNLKPYAQKILECGMRRYPNDDDIRFDLIDLYHESESAQLRMKAVQYCEEYYYIELKNEDSAHFTERSRERPFTLNRLISLFNSYIGMDYYRRLYSITESLPQIVDLEDPRCLALLPRNMGVAEMEQGHYANAVQLFLEAYSKDPSDQTISLLSNTCYKAGKKDVGYLLREFLVAQEPNEAERYIQLVNAIVSYEYIPAGVNEDGSVRFDEIGVTLRPYEKYLIPLLYRAMICGICDEIDQQNIIKYLTVRFKTKAAQDAVDFYHENFRSEQWKVDNYKKKIASLQEVLDFSIINRIEEGIKMMGTPGYANTEIERIFNRLKITE